MMHLKTAYNITLKESIPTFYYLDYVFRMQKEQQKMQKNFKKNECCLVKNTVS